MSALELKIPPPIVTLLTGLAMWVVARQLPALDIAWHWRAAIALSLVALGVSFAVAGFRAFQRAATTISPLNPEGASSIVSSGIYSFTRNPMYMGLTTVLLGWAVWLSVPWVFVGPVLFAFYITRFQII